MELRDEILARLDQLGLPYELHRHAPIPPDSDRQQMGLTFEAAAVKHLLLTVRNRSRYYLAMLPADKTADLRAAARALGSSRLCFAPEEDALQLLGEGHGIVGATGLIRDRDCRIRMVFDQSLRGCSRIAMHPALSSETLVMSFDALEHYVAATGHEILFYDF